MQLDQAVINLCALGWGWGFPAERFAGRPLSLAATPARCSGPWTDGLAPFGNLPQQAVLVGAALPEAAGVQK